MQHWTGNRHMKCNTGQETAIIDAIGATLNIIDATLNIIDATLNIHVCSTEHH
jgi:hypothetical protein